MIDYFTYPQGDVQTWDESLGERVVHELPADLAHLVSQGEGTVHAFQDSLSVREQETLRAMMIGGVMPINEKMLEYSELRLRDKVSGFIYQMTDPLTVNLASLPVTESEIWIAAAMRYQLLTEAGRKLAQPDPGDIAHGIPSLLSTPIVDYEAPTVEDCERILTEITTSLSRLRRFKRIWLRGQRQEYFIKRPLDILEWLHFGQAGCSIPSLVPSLGRFALNNPGKVDLSYAFGGPSHWWKKPFLVWIIRQNPQWLRHYPEFLERLDNALKSEDDMMFSKILVDIVMDPKVPTEVDDLRQWFFAHYKYSSWIWVLQQYGYLASMLDITTDLDAALFFAQAQMQEGRFLLTEPAAGRVIYVFAECENSAAFWDVDRVDWGDSDWARQLPERVLAQDAGCLVGSTWFRQNLYGHMVIARIRLNGNECLTSKKVEDIFPRPEADLLLRTLLESRPVPEGLYW